MKEKGTYPIIGQSDDLPLYADFMQVSQLDATVLKEMAQRLGTSKQLVSCQVDFENTYKTRLTESRENGMRFRLGAESVMLPKKPSLGGRIIQAYFGSPTGTKYRDLNPVPVARQNLQDSLSRACETVESNSDHSSSIIEESHGIVMPLICLRLAGIRKGHLVIPHRLRVRDRPNRGHWVW